MSDLDGHREHYKRALEALRSGVPNRDAVSVLGCSQDRVVERFQSQLDAVDALAADDRQSPGMLIEGGFGAGKSHVRLYPGETLDTVETELRIDYSERPELHAVAETDDDQAAPDHS